MDTRNKSCPNCGENQVEGRNNDTHRKSMLYLHAIAGLVFSAITILLIVYAYFFTPRGSHGDVAVLVGLSWCTTVFALFFGIRSIGKRKELSFALRLIIMLGIIFTIAAVLVPYVLFSV